ncbi:type I DNA topoisomerase [Mycoplasmopsis felifaucium]|uniref:type I DNA topoisomerase n=1 Tax=Mycoplasmopsis felifaucium TaxID=35768 RepID=UPI0004810988
MNKLVIVESPNKVETIKKYLGEGYEVLASVGHIVKLSTSGAMRLGIDLEKWEPKYVLDSTKKEVVKKLKEVVKKASIVYIATDPDREGEAIGEHLVKYLKCEDKYSRIKYNEITKDAILQAINHPGKLDQNLIEAQKARRMLDRIIGFRLSHLMQIKLSNSPSTPSAGRVQSIALKLVVDRENEINSFIPVEYHTVEAKINDNVLASIYIDKHLADEKNWVYPSELESVKKVLDKEPTNKLIVKNIKETTRSVGRLTPLKQAVLYKKSPFSSGVTQTSAQKLYEGYGDGGLISYPRTDSTRLSQNFINAAHKYIENKFGKEYVLAEIKGFKGDQDAHEAIRPTDITLLPEEAKAKYDLNNYDYQIYKLIYEHTLQCLMTPPVRKAKTYTFKKNTLAFKWTASSIVFDGYYIVKGEKEETTDPNYSENQEIDVQEFNIGNHQTKPPARYSEGALIEKLDEIKVGRPSTFASTVKIILQREYVINENGALHPTEFGKLVLSKLLLGFPDIINEGYTAKVEEELDMIAQNKIAVEPVMTDFYNKFTSNYEKASETVEHTLIEPEKLNENCPDDSGELLIRKNRYGDKFIACNNFPKCKYTRSLDNAEKPKRRFFKFKKKTS